MASYIDSSHSGQNGRHFADDIVRCILVNEKFLLFDWNCTEVCSWGSNWQWPIIGLDKGSAPNRRQAIISTIADFGLGQYWFVVHWKKSIRFETKSNKFPIKWVYFNVVCEISVISVRLQCVTANLVILCEANLKYMFTGIATTAIYIVYPILNTCFAYFLILSEKFALNYIPNLRASHPIIATFLPISKA